MNWYYVSAGQQAGPVDDAQLEELVRTGQVQPDTLVWSEGMANWQPYREVKAVPAGASAIPEPPLMMTFGVPMAANEAVCAECGRIFPVENMIQYGSSRVCAGCKPIFMQKLAEGARISTGGLNFAGFWLRFGAVLIDWLVLSVVNFGIGLVVGLTAGQAAGIQSVDQLVRQMVVVMIQLAINISYECIMIGKFGATLGKMACKIKVVRADGSPVGYGLAIGRYFAKMLSGLICLVGYIMAAFDDEKRTLHDRICNTRVIIT